MINLSELENKLDDDRFNAIVRSSLSLHIYTDNWTIVVYNDGKYVLHHEEMTYNHFDSVDKAYNFITNKLAK